MKNIEPLTDKEKAQNIFDRRPCFNSSHTRTDEVCLDCHRPTPMFPEWDGKVSALNKEIESLRASDARTHTIALELHQRFCEKSVYNTIRGTISCKRWYQVNKDLSNKAPLEWLEGERREAEAKGYAKASSKILDIMNEFGDDPKDCLGILAEWFSLCESKESKNVHEEIVKAFGGFERKEQNPTERGEHHGKTVKKWQAITKPIADEAARSKIINPQDMNKIIRSDTKEPKPTEPGDGA